MAFSLTNIVKLEGKLFSTFFATKILELNINQEFKSGVSLLIMTYRNPSLKFNHCFLYESSSNNEFLIFCCVETAEI